MNRWSGLLTLATLLMTLSMTLTTAATLTQESIPTTYQVQAGDSLWKIAEQFYGDGTQWAVIAEANGIDVENPRGLRVGELLIIPERQEEVRQPATTPLIPREVLFGNPDKVSARLSPDGTRISYLAPVDGVLNVWVGPANDPTAAEPVTDDTGRGIRIYGWTFTNEHILYLQDKEGDENWRVYSVNLSTGETMDLTPVEGVQARIQGISPEFPDEIIIGLNDRIPQLHDLYRVNIDTGERTLVLENEGFLGFVIDDDYNVRFARRITPDGGSEILSPTDEGGWEPFVKIAMEDTLTTSPIGFDKTGRVLYMFDSRGRDTAALTAIDLDTGDQRTIAEDPRADLSDAMIHPTEKNVQAVAFTYERKQWQILDNSIAPDLAFLRTVADGDVEVVSRTRDDRRWIVAYLLDNGPVRYYRYDREEKKAQFLFTNRKSLEDLPLAHMHPVVIQSRDGLNLVSYYTLPVWNDRDGDARPDDKPLPMVLVVHGGPWSRDNWGYNALHQLLANRGYAVLSVNFRGSTGFGKGFINASNKEWGGKMHDDLIDAVDWTIQEGIANPDQVAIMGGSYGGYATLWGMTNTPETFACGVDVVGPSNLVTVFESIPPYWQPQVELFATRVGDHRTEEGRAFLIRRSPLTYVDRIARPLLIGQGANDPRVKQTESDQIVQAMQEKNVPVTYVLYPDEGHGFARPENNLAFFAVTEAFLAECLGERYEPIGDDFEGSSITVPAGAEQIPGLMEALSR
ncbi:MAG: alpha/beta fold hydrolase [Candidatus Bipolaricaulia bacterium]